ncbi:MAG: hypothetical protein LBU53_03375 [Zoogloeaceae bacterium]|nr:hypothetical protein [Zoogloeaceae bacterium]
MDDIAAGDTLIGSLPVHLAAVVCQRGAALTLKNVRRMTYGLPNKNVCPSKQQPQIINRNQQIKEILK